MEEAEGEEEGEEEEGGGGGGGKRRYYTYSCFATLSPTLYEIRTKKPNVKIREAWS